MTKPRPEFLALAERCGARLTGKPDGSEPIEIVFTIEAWRKFDALSAQDVSVPRELASKLVRTYDDAIIDAAHWTDMDGEVAQLRALLNGGEA